MPPSPLFPCLQCLGSEVSGIPGGRTLTNEDLRLVHAQLRAAAHSSNLRAMAAAEADQREMGGIAATGASATATASGAPKGGKVARKGRTLVVEPPSDATTCAAAIETLLWFGLALGEPSRKSGGSSGEKGGLSRRVTSFVDLEQLSACFDEHDAATVNGSAASSSGSVDPLPDSYGIDDVSLSNWDWMAAMSEAGLREDSQDSMSRAPSMNSSGGESAAQRAHPLSSLTERPPQPADLLGSLPGAGAQLGAAAAPGLGDAVPSEHFDTECSSEGGSGRADESGRASPLGEVDPMLTGSNEASVSVAVGDDAESDDDAADDREDAGGSTTPTGDGPNLEAYSYVSPRHKERLQPAKGGFPRSGERAEARRKASEAEAAEAEAEGDGHGQTQAQATRRSKRDAKPKAFLLDEISVERPLLKWEKEQQEQREGKKRSNSAPAPAPRPLKRRPSRESSTGRYETDGETSPSKSTPFAYGLGAAVDFSEADGWDARDGMGIFPPVAMGAAAPMGAPFLHMSSDYLLGGTVAGSEALLLGGSVDAMRRW